MGKAKNKKVSISEFVSEKRLEKIMKIIHNVSSVDDAYDKIENLLIDDYKVKGLGTNRLVLISRDKKYKDLIVKVAGDTHGIEANYREFYNGDLDPKRLTRSFSISKNGVFLIQERVKPFTSDMMKENKKQVRNMLKHLENKILLVDCKLSNFKNFGYRKNGDIVLLDHGDTVPLSDYENGKIVNILEESNVSLRCKDPAKGQIGSKDPKPCNGKLEYDKNYEFFVCKKCGNKSPIHHAYKEYYGYSRLVATNDNQFLNNYQEGFDPVEYAKKVHQDNIRRYCQDTMEDVEKTDKECNNMEKIINGKKCQQIKGYWLPIMKDNRAAVSRMASVKRGQMKPSEYLESFGFEPDEFKMSKDDHIESKNDKASRIPDELIDLSNRIVQMARKERPVKISTFDEATKWKNGYYFPVRVSVHSLKFTMRDINNTVRSMNSVSYSYYEGDMLFIKLKLKKEEIIALDKGEEPSNEHKRETASDIVKHEPVTDAGIPEPDEEEIDSHLGFDENDENVDISPDLNEQYDDTSDDDTSSTCNYTFEELGNLETEVCNGLDCIPYKGYYIPITILDRYYNGNSNLFELPSPTKMFKDSSYDQKLFLIDRESESDTNNTVEKPEAYNPEYHVDDRDFTIDSEEAFNTYLRQNDEKICSKLVSFCDKYCYNDKGYATVPYDDLCEFINGIKLDGINDHTLALDDYDFTPNPYSITNLSVVGCMSDYVMKKSYEIEIIGKERKFSIDERLRMVITDLCNIKDFSAGLPTDPVEILCDIAYVKKYHYETLEFFKMTERETVMFESIASLLFEYLDFDDENMKNRFENSVEYVAGLMLTTIDNYLRNNDKLSIYEYSHIVAALDKLYAQFVNGVIIASKTNDCMRNIMFDYVNEDLDEPATMNELSDLSNKLNNIGKIEPSESVNVENNPVTLEDKKSNLLAATIAIMGNSAEIDIRDLIGFDLLINIPSNEEDDQFDGSGLKVSINLYDLIMKNLKNFKEDIVNRIKYTTM